MKKRYTRIKSIITAGILFFFLACADYYAGNEFFDQQQLELNCEIVQQYITRANDMGFANGDEVGVFIVNRTSNGEMQPLLAQGNQADNVKFTYDSGTGVWKGNKTIYWKDKVTHVDAFGYYPYNASLSDVKAYPFTIQSKQNETNNEDKDLSGYEASDFLWAVTTDASPASPLISLKYHHLMAGIEIRLEQGDGFESGEWEQLEKSIVIVNTLERSTINLQAGNITPLDGETITIIPQQQGDKWRAIVIPQIIPAQQNLLAITIDGDSYHFNRPEKTELYSGKLHKFTIKVDKHLPKGDYVFTLLDEAVTAWENDGLSHQGSTKDYIVVTLEKDQFLDDVIKKMGILPENIINLKLDGEMSNDDNWDYTEKEDLQLRSNFSYLRHQLPNLESLNMKDLRLRRTHRQPTETYVYHGGKEDDGVYLDGINREWWKKNVGLELENFDDVIPMKAFYDIPTLQSVILPDHLKAIGSEAFVGCSLKSSCILPEGLIYIGDHAFAGGRTGSLMTGDLYIPSSCQYIGSYAFSGQNFNNELILPEHMSHLGRDAFANCKFMTGYLHIPEGLKEINNAWQGMTGLSGFAEVPEGAVKINGIGCPISSLHIPEGVTELNGLFHELEETQRTSLKEVTLPSTLRVLGEKIFAGAGIQHIKLPEGITKIPQSCFENCRSLQDTIYLPSTIVTIDAFAFEACTSLKAIVLPENLAEIKESAFNNCISLGYIRCLGSIPPRLSMRSGWESFSGLPLGYATLVVPEGSIDTYRNAPGWCEFKRITSYKNFVCRPQQDKLLNKGRVMDIILNADGDWSITHCPTWAHPNLTSGHKKTALQISVDDLNQGNGNRRDSIVFKLNGQTEENGKTITCTYKLQQYDYIYNEDTEMPLQHATRGNGQINIFICGDGYDAQDISDGTYLSDMKQEMAYFFDIEPYKTYKDYFNVYTSIALSRESGINSTNKWRETRFNTYHGDGCKDVRLSCDYDAVMSYALTVSPQIMPNGPSAPVAILIANTTHYDGITALWEDNSALAVCTKSADDYPYDARGVIQHEAGGHGFGKLADEYIYHRKNIQTCACLCCRHVPELLAMKSLGWARNLSLSGKYKDIEWRQLIFDPQYSDICDIFEGGFFHLGVYRSEHNSCMNNNVPYFSTISRMAIVERIKQYAGETFDYDDFVAHDSREHGSKFITRSIPATSDNNALGNGIHLPTPIIKKGGVIDLLKKNRKK